MEDVSEMIQPPPECMKEMRLQAVRDLEESATLRVTNTPEVGIAHVVNFEDYSDFSKLCRVTACVIRFVNSIKARSSKPVSPIGSGSLTSEVLFSESLWMLESQKSAAESKLRTTVCSAGSNQGHEWNLEVQGKTLQLVSPGNS